MFSIVQEVEHDKVITDLPRAILTALTRTCVEAAPHALNGAC
jgi:hypothetical protein